MTPKASRKRIKPRSLAKQPHLPVPRLNERICLIWVGAIFLLHSLGLAFLFVPLTGLFDYHPVIEQDWGLHFHHLKSLEAFWQQDRRLWGYNPFFMAGYPSNTIQDLSIKLFEILALILSVFGLDLIQAFKLTVFIATACVPWMMFFAARNLFPREPIIHLLAVLLGTAYWWNSYPREMFFYGMLGFPIASYLSLMVLSLLYRISKSIDRFTAMHWAWMATAVVILPLHLQALLILAPATIALLITNGGAAAQRLLLWIGVGAMVSLSANLIWLLPAFDHRGDDVSATIVTQLRLFVSTDLFAFPGDYLIPGGFRTFRASFWENGLRWTLLILGVMGLVRLLRTSEQRDLGVVMASGAFTLFLLTYFGSLIPSLKGLQPLRFKIPYDLFLVLASSYLVGCWNRPPSNRRAIFISVLFAVGLITALTNTIKTESANKMRLRTEVSQEVKEIVEWIRQETATNGRVLFEESGEETGFVYDGMYLSSFIPYWTGRQLIGGPINLYNDRHHFAEFHSARFFKRDVATLTDGELVSYFRNYNVGAVVAFHPRSVQRLLSSGLVSVERRLGDVHLMRVSQPLNWFLEGQGQLEAGFNRIHASKIQGNVVILKYHWAEELLTNPPLKVEPHRVLDDPIPFIKIIDPPPEFTLAITG
jgi:hypothetical protein